MVSQLEKNIGAENERLNTLIKETETRLAQVEKQAEVLLQNAIVQFISGDFARLKNDLQRSLQNINGQIQNQNVASLQSLVSGQLGEGLLGNLASGAIGSAFQGGGSNLGSIVSGGINQAVGSFFQNENILNQSKSQNSVALHQIIQNALKNL